MLTRQQLLILFWCTNQFTTSPHIFIQKFIYLIRRNGFRYIFIWSQNFEKWFILTVSFESWVLSLNPISRILRNLLGRFFGIKCALKIFFEIFLTSGGISGIFQRWPNAARGFAGKLYIFVQLWLQNDVALVPFD